MSYQGWSCLALQPEEQGNHSSSCKPLKGGEERRAVWWELMEHSYFCTTQSNISPPNCLQLSRNWGHSQFRLKSSFPAGRATGLCVSMGRELLSGHIQLWNPQRTWPCDPRGRVLCPGVIISWSTGHWTLSLLSPGLSQCFQCIIPGITAHFQQVTVSMDSHPLMSKLCTWGRKRAVLGQVESFGRQMGFFFVYLKLKLDTN